MAKPSENGVAVHRAELAAANLQLAEQIIAFCSPGYGPRGGHKLIVDDESLVLRDSPAAALREVHINDALARPYKNLASGVQAHYGDGGTTALLLAARLVRAGLEHARAGVPIPASLEGYELARKQAIAVLQSVAQPAEAADLLAGVAPAHESGPVVAGLRQLGMDLHGHIDLGRIDIRVEAGEPGWLEGLVLDPQAAPDVRRITNAGVLIVAGDWDAKMRGASVHVSTLAGLHVAREEERSRMALLETNILEAGVQLVLARKAVPDELANRLAHRGVIVCSNVSADAAGRMAAASGAQPVPNPAGITASALGRADVSRRPSRVGGWLATCPGPSATLVIHAAPGMAEAATDAAERLLRAAGPILADPRGVPGGGSWQRRVAASLRKAAPLAPGKKSLTVAAAAEAFDALADDALRNSGRNPLDGRGALEAPPEPYGALCHAVEAAFEVARQILRLDGRYDKRPSTPEALRGGTGPAGSPKGMPGDIPPLM